ncbi:MAG: TetR/AcrR family transcriptional regulator [Bacteroidales bacterium]|nr:TetR/AcrR family transcriptional regulator [Bacteroidales bacterium]
MSPRTPEQFKEIRAEKKAQIMQAALEVFAEKTFQGASVSMIAKKAGISKGLLYNYFSSKEDLLKQIIWQVWNNFVELFESKNADNFNETDFEEIIKLSFDMLKTDYKFWKLYISLVMQPAAIKFLEEKIPEFMDEYLNLYVNYYQKKGIKNPLAEARLLGSALDGVSLNYILDPENFPLEEVQRLIIEKFK